MRRQQRGSWLLAATLATISSTWTTAHAQSSTYLAIGGGFSKQPTSSQVVLEKNMDLFRSSAHALGVKDHRLTRLFGAGGFKNRTDVFERQDVSVAELFASQILGFGDCAGCEFRHNHLDPLEGPATAREVSGSIKAAAMDMVGGDQYRLYFSGHGSPAEQNRYDRNIMILWDGAYSVQNLAKDLSAFEDEVNVQLLMVQCYSGGFAQIMFEDADPTSQPTTASQCGFFSQVRDRVASGCSANINFRKEYSPFFFAALTGVSEKGKAVQADFNKDGRVTSNEAHAYVIAHEDSFDIPVSTASEFLRYRSDELEDVQIPASVRLNDTLTAAERYVFKTLAAATGYDEQPRLAVKPPAFAQGLRHVQERIQDLQRQAKEADARLSVLQDKFGHDLNNVASDELIQSARTQGDADAQIKSLASELEKLPHYRPLEQAVTELDALGELELAAKYEAAQWERLDYLFTTKALEYKADIAGSQLTKDKYQQLKQCESAPFFQ